MKKLMIATLAAVAAGGAFATPRVWDFKASAKHMYEKEQRVNNTTVYVKSAKTSKLEGFFIQDVDGATTLARSDLNVGYNAGGPISAKRGFLVVLNRSAENAYRRPKIMPAQLDVKRSVTRASASGSTSRFTYAYQAYFYAGPFASAADNIGNTTWTASQDDGGDVLFYGGATAEPYAGGTATRSYGTFGSTLYLFGQHNTYNRWDNTLVQPAVCAFGDAWLNGAGFGTGSGVGTACCGWGSLDGDPSSISGNLKGGLFLCSIGGRIANATMGYFALGLEDLYAADLSNPIVIGHAVQIDNAGYTDPVNGNDKQWADGDIVLNTTDVVSGNWTLRPRTGAFAPIDLTPGEIAWFGLTGAPNFATSQEVATYVKGANQRLFAGYSLTVGNAANDAAQPQNRQGTNTSGLIPFDFATKYF